MFVSAVQGELHVDRGRTLLGAGPRSMIDVYPCAGGDGLDAVLECSREVSGEPFRKLALATRQRPL